MDERRVTASEPGARDAGRHLEWEGAFNVRDLGGLAAAHGRRTRRGAIVRADALDRLTAAGWEALLAHGVRTVIDLRNDSERGGLAAAPAEITTIHLPLDGERDRQFWDIWSSGPQFGTPLYFGPHLRRLPERTAAVLGAVAGAPAGGVVVHCQGGRDRTGQVSMVLLCLAGVAPADIAADYALSAGRLRARSEAEGVRDDGPELEAFLRSRGTSAEHVIVELLQSVDMEERVRAGGAPETDIAALRARLLE